MKSKLFVLPWIVGLLILLCGVGVAQDAALDSQIESLRADIRADKVALITDAMQFNDQDAKAFWPIYRKYEFDLGKIQDQRVALIKSYADKFNTMTDADAKGLLEKSLDFEAQRVQLKKKYVSEFEKGKLSSLVIAKFFQLEYRLNLVLDLKLAAELPSLLVKPAASAKQ